MLEPYIDVETQCPFCRRRTNFRLSLQRYNLWQSGELIQNVFPEMSADDREKLISGTCEECFPKLKK